MSKKFKFKKPNFLVYGATRIFALSIEDVEDTEELLLNVQEDSKNMEEIIDGYTNRLKSVTSPSISKDIYKTREQIMVGHIFKKMELCRGVTLGFSINVYLREGFYAGFNYDYEIYGGVLGKKFKKATTSTLEGVRRLSGFDLSSIGYEVLEKIDLEILGSTKEDILEVSKMFFEDQSNTTTELLEICLGLISTPLRKKTTAQISWAGSKLEYCYSPIIIKDDEEGKVKSKKGSSKKEQEKVL